MNRYLVCGIILLLNNCFADGELQDGKMHLYVNSRNNTVQCKVQQLCDIALLPGDTFQSWFMTNGDAWADSAKSKSTYTDKDGVQHIILQATTSSSNNPVILVGTSEQYHFNLIANTTAKTNNYVFINQKNSSFNSTNAVIDDGLAIKLDTKKMDCKYYSKGDTDSYIRPVKVCNDGKKTYIQMQGNIDTTDLPTIYTFGTQGQLLQLNNPRYRKPYFIVDNVLRRIAVVSGSVDNDNQVRVDVYYGEEPGFFKKLMQQYDRG